MLIEKRKMGHPPEPVLAEAGTGMTFVFIEKLFSTSAVTPAKAGVPSGFCAFLMGFPVDC
ncbi:MAG: hypothetical protein ABTQ34_06130 [Bdellovibrionales bacterium]